MPESLQQIEERIARFYEEAEKIDDNCGFVTFKNSNKNSSIPLFKEITEKIISCILESYEPCSVNNIELTLHTLLSLSLACKEFHTIVFETAIPELTKKVVAVKDSFKQIPIEVDNMFMIDPLTVSLKHLQIIAQSHDLTDSGSKIRVVDRLFKKLEITVPCRLPSCIRSQLIYERRMYRMRPSVHDSLSYSLHSYLYVYPNDEKYTLLYRDIKSIGCEPLGIKRLIKLHELGFHSTKDIKMKENEINKMVEDFHRINSNSKKIDYKRNQKNKTQQRCECGNFMSDKCDNVCCGLCCRTHINYCLWHTK